MQYNIYFRKENWELFQLEDNKSALVNDLLEAHYGRGAGRGVQRPASQSKTESQKIQPIKILDTLPDRPKVDVPGVTRGFAPKAPDPETGYPCCTQNKPCKHWQWDGVKSAYVNELTGKEREVL